MNIDFVQFCRDYNISHTHETDDWVNIDCPICRHQGTRGYKGGFNIPGGYYNCWNCGGQDVRFVVAELLSLSYYEASSLLEKYSNQLSVRRKVRKEASGISNIDLPVKGLDERCRRYLIKRNFDLDYIERKYRVCGASLTGEWAGRIIIPIFYRGRLVSFQGRSLYGKRKCKELGILRYRTLARDRSVVDPKHVLYNIDNCTTDSLIVCEGAFDVWRIGDGCCGTLGTTVTSVQRKLMLKYNHIYILFDPEPEAQARARKLATELIQGSIRTVAIIDTGLDHDPGDMTDREVADLRRNVHSA